jgi:phenylalanyl-tRNA synthetase alpha chain
MDILNEIKRLAHEAKLVQIKNQEDLNEYRLTYLSKKGKVAELFEIFKNLEGNEKRLVGKPLNEAKSIIESIFVEQQSKLKQIRVENIGFDFTKPPANAYYGHVHPISQIQEEIISVFEKIGFNVSQGPEIEDDWHNFSSLNFPQEHPARDMQDTFFVEKDPDWALRTHTSSVQIRVMDVKRPPIRTLAPGRVFRNEAVSSRSHCMFHQIEGLYIDQGVSFADMKQTLLYFAKEFFGESTRIRLRPSYFPFTEPSAEMDVYWGLNSETDYRITKGTGWLEVMGCGMVDPEVLRSSGINPDVYSGFAFGMGIERIAMNRFQITDLRHFFDNDSRFLSQFS